mmetsp:Transcript_72993/g.115977  ORF Transcript_72993/g.115977 Transcript_72993/m.115977 type:complete len:233 (+) Transcript_72993:271-969(+)
MFKIRFGIVIPKVSAACCLSTTHELKVRGHEAKARMSSHRFRGMDSSDVRPQLTTAKRAELDAFAHVRGSATQLLAATRIRLMQSVVLRRAILRCDPSACFILTHEFKVERHVAKALIALHRRCGLDSSLTCPNLASAVRTKLHTLAARSVATDLFAPTQTDLVVQGVVILLAVSRTRAPTRLIFCTHLLKVRRLRAQCDVVPCTIRDASIMLALCGATGEGARLVIKGIGV